MAKTKIKIFDLDYLRNADYTDDDLFLIFETPSLKYSLLYGMFKFAGIQIPNNDIVKFVKCKNWVYKNFWSTKKCRDFEDIVKDIYKRVYYMSEYNARAKAQTFIIQYGLTNKNVKNKPQYIFGLEK